MCIYAIMVFAAPASETNVRNIVFKQNVNNDDNGKSGIYKDGEVADYLYVQDSVTLDFNEYGTTGHYTVTITSMSGKMGIFSTNI